jgi:hypothetical protein
MKSLLAAVTVLAVSTVQADTIYVDVNCPGPGDARSSLREFAGGCRSCCWRWRQSARRRDSAVRGYQQGGAI